MKVALISPAFSTQGHLFGAERLIVGLYQGLSEICDTDWLQVPVSEATWDDVLESYLNCYDLDVTRYDLVISTKTPTFMVRHPNHICWLIHQMRVFYDRFEDEYGHCDPSSLAEQKQRREIIHKLDNYAFSRVRKVFTIGHEVARRLKVNNGFEAEALHPALNNKGYSCGGQEYLLLPGRLHRWKRVDLAIRALKLIDEPIDLLIPGKGEDERLFREIADGDPRIKFLGYVSDEELVELYAHSLAVLFLPKDEDFGYVTLEAMLSHKPVITTSDSGEPSHFVKDGITGLVVPPNEKEVAAAMRIFLKDRQRARDMGEEAFAASPNHSWQSIAQRLLEAGGGLPPISSYAPAENDQAPGPRVLVSDNQVLDPPVGGGRIRIYHLYRNLARLGFNVTYVGAYDWPGPILRDQYLAPHFREIVTPLTQPHFRLNSWIQRLVGGKTVIDVTIPYLLRFSPQFRRLAEAHARNSQVVIISHPWVHPYVPRRPDQLLIYDSHNCEHTVKKQILGTNIVGRLLVAGVKRLERKLCREADLVFACSIEDADQLARLYGIQRDKVVLVPNGVDIQEIAPPNEQEKTLAKEELGFSPDKPLLMFVGSGYQPNVEAAIFVAKELTRAFPDSNFCIVGSVKDSIESGEETSITKTFPNVTWTGTVDNDRKLLIYRASDIALNPMSSGSGTNLKMLDYFAAGVPAITTAAGARGLELTGEECIICPASKFEKAIKTLQYNPALRSQLGRRGREVAVSRFSWSQIAGTVAEAIGSSVQREETHARTRAT